MVVYFNDILEYSKNKRQHFKHLRQSFQHFAKPKTLHKYEKVQILSREPCYLSYVVSKDEIKMDSCKAEPILDWMMPKIHHGIQSFHGLTSFYLWFIKHFSTIFAPITKC